MKNISGKIVLITGGAMGIGRELAFRFSNDKARLVLIDIVREELEKTAGELRKAGGDIHTYICDVSNRDNIYAMAEKVKKEVGRVDILVNNAGVLFSGEFLTMPDAHLQKTMDINILAHFWTMKAFLPDMVAKNEGHVVNISSAAGLIGVAGLAVYCASKHAVVGLTDSVRLELEKKNIRGVRFTTICPSFINTGLVTGVTAPRLVPLLSVEEIADKIYNAIKKDKIVLMEPLFVKFIPLMKALTARSVFDFFGKLLGVHTATDTLKGRNP